MSEIRSTQWARALLGSVLVSTLLTGCHATQSGYPTAQITTQSSSPSTTTSSRIPSSTTHSTHQTPVPSSSPTVLSPTEDGYVFIATKSGKTRCQINTESVGCEANFLHSPLKDGEHANGVNISSAGVVHWILGNLGDIPTTTLDYKTYSANGWTIIATSQGTRFINNASHHGMFVSVERVDTF